MLIIGLTGGIGSGKSTLAALLTQRGAEIIDVDQLGRQVIAPGGRAEAAVLAEFGDGVADRAGHIHRPSLGLVVFGRPEALVRLNAISHPAINAELAECIDQLADDAIVALDMAVLVESVLGRGDPEHSYSKVVVVETPLEMRIERAVARGMAADDVRARIASQATDAQRRAVADAVVCNDSDRAALAHRVDELWAQIMRWRDSQPG